MSFSNRQFNVNGREDEQLLTALKLVFSQAGWKGAKAFYNSPKGLVFQWHQSGEGVSFPTPLNADEVFPMVKAWLKSKEAAAIKLDDWDENSDHDGHNEKGWRIFCEDWGYVGNDHYAFCCISPAYIWYGK